jgi:hypothetical protein
VFYIQAGEVKLTVISPQGKETVVAILEPGSFSEGDRRAAGIYYSNCLEGARIVRIDKQSMLRLLQDDRTFSALFLPICWLGTFIQGTLDQSSIPARSGWPGSCCSWLVQEEGKPEEVIPRIGQNAAR